MPNNKINLLMAVHCHQPVGNFDGVFKEAYDKSYLPFIKALEKHPKIKVALHYSGCLLDWIKANRPEFLETLKRLVNAGQVEMMTGGYDEPIMPLVPDRDKLGQIKMHMDFIKKLTGYQSKGIWLTERVWEPYLAKIFSQAGLSYTIVDDSHFELAGKKVEDILGYYLTEEENRVVAIFPSSKILRYAMPFKLPSETINYLRSMATPEGTRAVTFGDDGEKFGLWPQTYKWVYEEGWLENFLKALEDNSDWINILTPAEYLKNHEPLGRIYLPCASYPEMLEWSGGYFKNFLVKYPEANWMQKRVFEVSEKLGKLKAHPDTKGVGTKLKAATESLYKSQCNCAYWHGVFGGLYLHHLRHAIYSNLIDAQKMIDNSTKAKDSLKSEVGDIDKDGFDEIAVKNGPLNIFIDPHGGGSILELDYTPKSLNLVNTMTRRPESYHKKISTGGSATYNAKDANPGVASIHDLVNSKEKNLKDFLNYDLYRKSFLIEHFLSNDANPKSFSKAALKELGDFTAKPYSPTLKKAANNITVSLKRTGGVLTNDKLLTLELEKILQIESKKAGLNISYSLKNTQDVEGDLWFGAEFNLSLMDPKFCETGELLNINKLQLQDKWFNLSLEYSFTKNAGLWFYPVETVSESESGFEKTYQQVCLLFHWRLALKPGQIWGVDISLGIK